MAESNWDDLLLISRGAQLDVHAVIIRHKNRIEKFRKSAPGARYRDDVLPYLETSELALSDTVRLVRSLAADSRADNR
jgi:hypothetical protein